MGKGNNARCVNEMKHLYLSISGNFANEKVVDIGVCYIDRAGAGVLAC